MNWTDFDKWIDESHPNGWSSPEPQYKECYYCEGCGKVDNDEICDECNGRGVVEMSEEEVEEEREYVKMHRDEMEWEVARDPKK